MAHSLAPAAQLIFDQIAEAKPLYAALCRSNQLIPDDPHSEIRCLQAEFKALKKHAV